MRRLFHLCAALVLACAAPAAHAADPAHYEVRARLSPAGELLADVAIAAPPAEIGEDREITFLIGERFDILLARAQGAEVVMSPVDEPIPDLRRITFRFAETPAETVVLRLQYEGPLDSGGDGVEPFTPERVELSVDHMWFPVRDDIAMRFTSDLWLTGLAGDLVVVAQGEIHRNDRGLHIRRDTLDVDLPMVAARDLVVHTAPGVEFYTADIRPKLVGIFHRHSIAAARFMAEWFGEPRQPIRMVVVSRPQTSAYARAGYTVLSDGGEAAAAGAEEEFPAANPAPHVAHEIAHPWWSPADPLSEDYWLSESVAEYAALRYVQATFGEADFVRLVDAKRQRAAGSAPLLQGRRPTAVQLYQLGPLRLVELEARIGRAAMDETLSRLGRSPPSTTADFTAVLAEVAGTESAIEFERALRSEPGPANPAPAAPPGA
mgnify:CR=1 FL=1